MISKESKRKDWEFGGYDIDNECTCNDCPFNIRQKCAVAFDLNNYAGFCMEWNKHERK